MSDFSVPRWMLLTTSFFSFITRRGVISVQRIALLLKLSLIISHHTSFQEMPPSLNMSIHILAWVDQLGEGTWEIVYFRVLVHSLVFILYIETILMTLCSCLSYFWSWGQWFRAYGMIRTAEATNQTRFDLTVMWEYPDESCSMEDEAGLNDSGFNWF